MAVTRAALHGAADELNRVASAIESYEGALRGQVKALTDAGDTIAQSWSGPDPEQLNERHLAWLAKVYESPNVIGPIAIELRNWAQSAWNISDLLPGDDEHGDPDLLLIRNEVASRWGLSCRLSSESLVETIVQLEKMARADVDDDAYDLLGDFFAGGLDALGDLFAGFGDVARPIGWAEWIAGQQPHTEDYDFALMANDVYDVDGWNHPERIVADGWHRVSASDLPAGLTPADFENGEFGDDTRAALYTDDQGHYVLAFAGTDSGSDALTDVFQGLGLSTRQYERGRSLTERVHAAYGGNLVLTGHSLGGGVAAYGALATGSPAVTFNAAGLSDANLEAVGLDWQQGRADVAHTGQIRAYHVDSDALTNVQESADDIPDAVGTPITIANPIEQPSDWWWLAPPVAAGAQGAHSVDMHLMENVLGGMRHSDVTFSTDSYVVTEGGAVERRQTQSTYEGGWFTR